MNTGMLWFDNNPKTDIATKILDGVSYYKKKYGLNPDMCVINPNMHGPEGITVKNIEIRTNNTILPNHFLIGNETAEET